MYVVIIKLYFVLDGDSILILGFDGLIWCSFFWGEWVLNIGWIVFVIYFIYVEWIDLD